MSSTTDSPAPLATLLVDVGAAVEAEVAGRLSPLAVSPADVDVLRLVARSPGISQREAAAALGVFPTHLGARVASLCERGLLARRLFRDGRRRYALSVTPRGIECLREVARVCGQHQDELLDGLDEQERRVLEELLGRLARGTALVR